MSIYVTEQLQQAISLIKAGKKQEGGRLLNQVLKADPANEAAWLWAARIVGTDEKRIYCLNQALALNPQNQIARQALAKLEARTAATTPPAPTAPAAAVQQPSQPPAGWPKMSGSI
jgi:Tfp pilus assembly protein PilF